MFPTVLKNQGIIPLKEILSLMRYSVSVTTGLACLLSNHAANKSLFRVLLDQFTTVIAVAAKGIVRLGFQHDEMHPSQQSLSFIAAH